MFLRPKFLLVWLGTERIIIWVSGFIELLFSSFSLGFYGGLPLSFFSLSESLAVGCVQHSFLHLTLPNKYVASEGPGFGPQSVCVYNSSKCEIDDV